jgi:hypothetical protein
MKSGVDVRKGWMVLASLVFISSFSLSQKEKDVLVVITVFLSVCLTAQDHMQHCMNLLEKTTMILLFNNDFNNDFDALVSVKAQKQTVRLGSLQK